MAWLWELVLPGAQWPARATVVALFAAALAWITRRLRSREHLAEAALWALGAMLLLSPVVDAWYVLWILPLAVVTRSLPWLAFSYLVAFSYAWFQSQGLAPYFGGVEYALLFVLLVREVRARGNLAQGPASS